MSIVGGLVAGLGAGGINFLTGRYASKKNLSMQKEFAKHGLRWRVQDAKEAGINPLAALGANIPTGQPISVGTDFDLSQLGQDISRAMGSKMTKDERDLIDLKKELMRVKIDGQEIINNNARNIGTGSPFPSAEYNGTPKEIIKNGTKQVPSEVIAGIKDKPGIIAGKHATQMYGIDKFGNLNIQPTSEQAEINETDTVGHIRNQLSQLDTVVRSWLSGGKKFGPDFEKLIKKIRPKHDNPNYEYRWNRSKARFEPVKIGKDGRTQIFVKTPKWKRAKHFKVR